MRSRGAPLVLLLLAACQTAPPSPPPPPESALPRAPELALPADWRSSPPRAFESWVLEAFPEDRVTPIRKSDMRALQAALDEVVVARPEGGFEPVAVRAAIVLGRSRYSSCAALLIRRLEKRVLGPERWSDCGDAVAAAALARFPDPRRYAQRLVPLAVGSRPHPDLEVRVECAATALHAGYNEVVPFLLAVLRIGTFAGLADERDFPVSPTTAWARGRAAEALSLHAGVPLTYRPDGPIAHREAEAARLAELLLPVPPQAPLGRAPASRGPPGASAP